MSDNNPFQLRRLAAGLLAQVDDIFWRLTHGQPVSFAEDHLTLERHAHEAIKKAERLERLEKRAADRRPTPERYRGPRGWFTKSTKKKVTKPRKKKK